MLDFVKRFPEKYGRIVASGSYVPQIDGLRFIAIIQVMFYHAALRGNRIIFPDSAPSDGAFALFPNGAAGVELFFFVSGYIISYPFLSGGAPRMAAFYKRRLFRLEPPYILALVICLVLLLVTGYRPGVHTAAAKSSVSVWESFAASLIYSHGFIFGAPSRLNPPLWSLELEIQFYLLAPFIVAAYRRIGARRIQVGLCISLAAIILQPLLTQNRYVNYIVVSHLYAFVLGIVACDLAIKHNPFKMPASTAYDAGFLLGLVGFFWSATQFYVREPLFAMLVLFVRASCIWLIYSGAARGRLGRHVLGLPWLTLVGGACYSIYLTHVPVMQTFSKLVFHWVKPWNLSSAWTLGVLLCVPPALVVGLVYYLLVERPCMRKDWPQRLMQAIR